MIKDKFSNSVKQLFTSRYLATLSIVLVILAVAYTVYIALSVRPSDLQLVTHYTAFGVTHIYRDQWWYLLSFAVFGLLVAFLHIALSIKVYEAKGRSLAIMVAWLGIAILAMAWVTSFSIINIWSPV